MEWTLNIVTSGDTNAKGIWGQIFLQNTKEMLATRNCTNDRSIWHQHLLVILFIFPMQTRVILLVLHKLLTSQNNPLIFLLEW